MPPTVELARRDGVELIRTGSWPAMTGTWKPTRGDLAAAVAALGCPAIRKPPLKIGHLDYRFTPGVGQSPGRHDGEPAVGWVENLRLGDGGHTLLGDYVGVPAWLNSIMASAYPDRSVEGHPNWRCTLGHTHPFVISSVALLGVTPPGVGTLRSLNDVADLFGVAASDGDVPPPVYATIRAAAEVHTGAMVALIPTDEDAQRLAVDGGEPAEQLHVTLAYLGDAADLDSAARQDVIDAVSSAINGAPVIEALGFYVAPYNPPGVTGAEGRQRDTCVVLGLSGDMLDAVHTLVFDALAYSGVDLPSQHAPWHAHTTLAYTDDLAKAVELVDRVGPVRFDRIRVALAGQHLDIPLIDPEPDQPDDELDGELVAAAAGDDGRNNLKTFFTKNPRGLKRWAIKRHPWTALYRILRSKVGSERAKRIASSWFRLVFGYWPGDRRHRRKVAASIGGTVTLNAEKVREAWNASDAPVSQWVVEARPGEVIVVDDTDRSFTRVPVVASGEDILFGTPEPYDPETEKTLVFASRAESRPEAGPLTVPQPVAEPTPTDPTPEPPEPPADPPAPEADPVEPPAAEPDQPTTEEDIVSTLSTDVRQRLGLADDADDAAILAALDALKTQAETPPTPDPQLVAASAAATAERDELRKEVDLLGEQVKEMSAKLAATEAEKAATVKASVIGEATRLGKIAPDPKVQKEWADDYDQAPAAVTRVLASIAPGTAVPVMASGHTGPAEPDGDIDAEWARVSHVFPPETAGTGA